MKHIEYLRKANEVARRSCAGGNTPFGAILVDEDGQVLMEQGNAEHELHDATAHAEVEAIAQANGALGSWRLEDCELYVTLEPCPMCAGAILNARIRRVWYGARDNTFGACGGVTNLFMENFPHPPALVGGVLEAECREVLSRFFAKLREG